MGDEKKRRVLAAAKEVFMRYGYKRVTMGDIAKEAGMSRPALYLVFQCKPDIFKGVVREFSTDALAEIRAEIADLDSVEAKLETMFDIWSVRPYELFHQAPDAKELADVGHDVAGKVIAKGYTEFEKVLASVLAVDKAALKKAGMTPALLARIMSLAARGFKEGAKDPAEFRQLIGGLIAAALAAGGHTRKVPKPKRRAG